MRPLQDVLCCVILLLTQGNVGAAFTPVGTVSSTSTASGRLYSGQVDVSYDDPAVCTLSFDQDVFDFTASSLNTSEGAVITNFVQWSQSEYSFNLGADATGEVSVNLPAGSVKNSGGDLNEEPTASFSFTFYKYPPSVQIAFDGFPLAATGRVTNLAYLVFNSSTVFDGSTHIAETGLAILPGELTIFNWQNINATHYSFNFVIDHTLDEEVIDTTPVSCVDPGSAVPDATYTKFPCYLCPRSEDCMAAVQAPHPSVPYLEFPFELSIQAVGALSLASTLVPFTYDTLWPVVHLEAADYTIGGSFDATVQWSEPMSDLLAVLPYIEPEGTPYTLEVVSSSSFRLTVTPANSSVVVIYMNGTQFSADTQLNANDYLSNILMATYDRAVVVHSIGPPLQGRISESYDRPLLGEHEYTSDLSTVDPGAIPNLTLSWDGFTTGVRFDMWITWGSNSSFVEVNVESPYTMVGFQMLLGPEYTVCLRAWNHWNNATTVCQAFLLPTVSVKADGSVRDLDLPPLLSPQDTEVPFVVTVYANTFMSLHPLKVLSFRGINRTAGDADPCAEAESVESLRCTSMNFHIEVPSATFVVFKEAILLNLNFGSVGWSDPSSKPQLQYFETYKQEWRVASHTCPGYMATDQWDAIAGTYKVSLCNLHSQFAVFQAAIAPEDLATTTEEATRADSESNALVFVAIAAVVFLLALACAGARLYCLQKGAFKNREWIDHNKFGIQAVAERLPSSPRRPPRRPQRRPPARRGGAPAAADAKGGAEHHDAQQLLPALPPIQEPGLIAPALQLPPPPTPPTPSIVEMGAGASTGAAALPAVGDLEDFAASAVASGQGQHESDELDDQGSERLSPVEVGRPLMLPGALDVERTSAPLARMSSRRLRVNRTPP